MTRVASLFLPQLAIERLRRTERSRAQPERPVRLPLPTGDDDPGACSAPRGGGWRPGARWARTDATRAGVDAAVASLPLHQRPPGRELGRRSEAAEHPFKGRVPKTGVAAPRAVLPALVPVAPARPLVLVAATGQKQLVSAACPAARALGLTPGMAATQARAFVADLDVRPADPAEDHAMLERLALHAARHWTPAAAVSAPDGLWLDLTGTAHLFGGEAAFCRRVIGFCAKLGLTASIAIAGTPGAAHAVARFGSARITIVPPGGEVQALAPLPLAALRLEPDALTAAARFGLERIADLLPMPRGPLARRLTLTTVTRLDQAIGRLAEPIVPVRPFEAPSAERRLLEPIATAEAITQVISDTLGDLIETLQARGLGVRTLEMVAARVDGVDQRIMIGTARATRDTAHLLRLLALKIDRIEPGLGLEAVRLTAGHAEPLGSTAMAAMLAGEDPVPDLALLIDRLAGRIGPQALFRAAPVESDVPERAVTRIGPLGNPGCWPRWTRPVRLLARPEPLSAVVALLPDAPPRRFVWRGATHIVVAGDGPERIHGEWWRREGETAACRDYFRVEDQDGGRFWLFRRGDGVEPATGDLSWYLHGFFA